MPSHTVAIVGRPNVGKSTLFNRLAGKRIAVVHEQPGVTRDRLVTLLERDDRRLYLIDTGGISMGGEELSEKTTESALEAVEEASLILFLVDVRTGLTDEDLAVAKILRRHADRVWVLVNKVERKDDELAFHEFHSLGLGEPLAVSALHGDGTLDLWEKLLKHFPATEEPGQQDDRLHLALVGRPNVGKSSIANALLGTERMIVSDMPGTTRDSVDAVLRWHGREVVLVDTAGLRRKARVKGRLEIYSNLRSLSAIDQSEVVVLVLDATRSVADQDLKIASHAHEAGRGLVLCVNKWDLVEKDSETLGEFVARIRKELEFVDYAPIIFVSAETHQRIHKVLEAAWSVYEQRQRRVSTSEVNRVLEQIQQRKPPHYHKGGTGRIYYGTQVSSRPPLFQLFVNRPDWFPEHYRRFLSNQLRKAFPYPGSRIKLKLKPRKEAEA